MEDALWHEPGSPELFRAQAQREAWEARDFEEFWQRQRAAGTRDPRRG